MAIALSVTAVVTVSVWAFAESPAAREKAALRKAEELRSWLEAKIIEGARFQRSFSIHLPAASNVGILHITWGGTLEKEYFQGDGEVFFFNYANESATISFMPQWFRMEEGFTLKLTREGKLTEAGFKFLVVSPLARVRLADKAPK